MASLLRPHTDVPMRQNSDKDFELADLDDFFDQYLETDLLQLNGTMVEPSSSDDLAHPFELSSSNESDPIQTSPMPNWDMSSNEAWRYKAPQSLEQNPASPSVPSNSLSVYPESRGKASASDPALFSLDDLFELDRLESDTRLSLSAPSTPKQQVTRPTKKALSNPDRSTRNGVKKSTTKTSTFAKMMRPSHFRAGVQDIWTRKMDSAADTFNLQLPSNALPSSPPPSTKLSQDENPHDFFPRDQPYTIAMSPLHGDEARDMHQSNYQLTPLSSPAIDMNSRNSTGNMFQFSNDTMATAYISHQISNAALSALQTPPPSHGIPMSTWGPDTPANLEFAFSASPDFQTLPTNGKASGWWSNGSAANVTAAQASTPTPTYHAANRSHNQNSDISFTSTSVAGLGISCDSAPFSGFGSELTTNGHSASNGFGASASSFEIGYAQHSAVYPPTPNGIHIGTPRPLTPPSHGSSPSHSPTLQPRFTRRRHSSQNRTTSSHRSHRRKSSNSSSQSNQRSNSVSVGFVNFTPDDSRKILTGVAPSGSSKTKARREREAADNRRKLSQAAVKAVMEAGGDIRQLEENGLLNLGGQ